MGRATQALLRVTGFLVVCLLALNTVIGISFYRQEDLPEPYVLVVSVSNCVMALGITIKLFVDLVNILRQDYHHV